MVYKKGNACEYLFVCDGGPIRIKEKKRGHLRYKNKYNMKGGGDVDDHLIVIGKQ